MIEREHCLRVPQRSSQVTEPDSWSGQGNHWLTEDFRSADSVQGVDLQWEETKWDVSGWSIASRPPTDGKGDEKTSNDQWITKMSTDDNYTRCGRSTDQGRLMRHIRQIGQKKLLRWYDIDFLAYTNSSPQGSIKHFCSSWWTMLFARSLYTTEWMSRSERKRESSQPFLHDALNHVHHWVIRERWSDFLSTSVDSTCTHFDFFIADRWAENTKDQFIVIG